MPRKKRSAKADPGADLLSVPGMEALDHLTREVLKVPKEEIERREKEWPNRKPKRAEEP